MPRRRSLLVPGSAFSQCWLDTQNLFPQLCLPSYLFLTRWCENIIKAHGKKKKSRKLRKWFFKWYLEALAHQCFNTAGRAACTARLSAAHQLPEHCHFYLQPVGTDLLDKNKSHNRELQLQEPLCRGNTLDPRCRCCTRRGSRLHRAVWHLLRHSRFQTDLYASVVASRKFNLSISQGEALQIKALLRTCSSPPSHSKTFAC